MWDKIVSFFMAVISFICGFFGVEFPKNRHNR